MPLRATAKFENRWDTLGAKSGEREQ